MRVVGADVAYKATWTLDRMSIGRTVDSQQNLVQESDELLGDSIQDELVLYHSHMIHTFITDNIIQTLAYR